MVQQVNHVLHHVLQVFEVQQQACLVKFLSMQRYTDLVIVTVRVFAFSFVVAQVVACGKRALYGDFVHPAPFAGRSFRIFRRDFLDSIVIAWDCSSPEPWLEVLSRYFARI